MRIVLRTLAYLLLLFSAEVAASWWIWGRAPADSLRVWYSGFWAFEAGRLRSWIPVLVLFLLMSIVAWFLLRRSAGLIVGWLFGATLTIGLEVLTSLLYWKSSQSSDLRSLFQSIWYWHRIPQASDLGWPSFRIYLRCHLTPWALVLLFGVMLLLLVGRSRGRLADSRIQP